MKAITTSRGLLTDRLREDIRRPSDSERSDPTLQPAVALGRIPCGRPQT